MAPTLQLIVTGLEVITISPFICIMDWLQPEGGLPLLAQHSSPENTKAPMYSFGSSLWEYRNARGTLKQGVSLLPPDHEQSRHYCHGHTVMLITTHNSLQDYGHLQCPDLFYFIYLWTSVIFLFLSWLCLTLYKPNKVVKKKGP